MFTFVKNLIADERRAVSGIHGALNRMSAAIERDVENAHRTIETLESGLMAELRAAESAIVTEAARLHSLIHGVTAEPPQAPPAPPAAAA